MTVAMEKVASPALPKPMTTLVNGSARPKSAPVTTMGRGRETSQLVSAEAGDTAVTLGALKLKAPAAPCTFVWSATVTLMKCGPPEPGNVTSSSVPSST
jgi:hypothetical protein